MDDTNAIFFATAGKGTEPFLAQEISQIKKFEVSVQEGKVFFNKQGITMSELRNITTLRTAERVFSCITHYDNSQVLCTGKKAFLDSFMSVVSKKGIYLQTDAVMRLLRGAQVNHADSKTNACMESTHIEPEDFEPKQKCPRLDVANSHNGSSNYTGTQAEISSSESKSNVGHPMTFRVSIKCSGKLKRRLDTKRLSRDASWRISHASGWRTLLKNPDIEVCIHINDERVTIGVPLTKLPISRRGYIQDPGLRAPVAWIMCHLADIKTGDIVVDPMCGKATILLEGMNDWRDAFYVGSDRNKEQLKIAAKNLETSQLSSFMNLVCMDGLNMPFRADAADAIVCDIPFNKKHLTSIGSIPFYQKFLQESSRVLRSGGRCVVLISQELARDILQEGVQNDAGEKKDKLVSDPESRLVTDTVSVDAKITGTTDLSSFGQSESMSSNISQCVKRSITSSPGEENPDSSDPLCETRPHTRSLCKTSLDISMNQDAKKLRNNSHSGNGIKSGFNSETTFSHVNQSQLVPLNNSQCLDRTTKQSESETNTVATNAQSAVRLVSEQNCSGNLSENKAPSPVDYPKDSGLQPSATDSLVLDSDNPPCTSMKCTSFWLETNCNFLFMSKHFVKLGETEACVIKYIKR